MVQRINIQTRLPAYEQTPLEIKPVGQTQYFEIAQEFTIGSLLKNQYSFMIGLTVVMLLLVKVMPSMGFCYL